MATKVVLLQKVRTSKTDWVYIIGNEKHLFVSSGTILEQFYAAVEDIQSKNAEENELVIISPSLISMIEDDIREFFPEILFIKFDQSALSGVFLKRFNIESLRKTYSGRTLYVGSDASGGHHKSVAAWAWCSGGFGGSYGMGICGFRDNNIAEFEGILRAIVENRETHFDRIHIYSDSQRALEYFERVVENEGYLPFVAGSYLEDLIEEAREVLGEKIVTLEWVRGHRTHRLNTTADCISRHARMSAQTGKNLRTVNLEADAMFSLFNKHYGS
jgi:ribonuclease HI